MQAEIKYDGLERADIHAESDEAKGSSYVTADLFNVPNFLARDWGIVTEASNFFVEEVPMLRLVGYDIDHDRGIYTLNLPFLRNQFGNWRMQVGMRYVF